MAHRHRRIRRKFRTLRVRIITLSLYLTIMADELQKLNDELDDLRAAVDADEAADAAIVVKLTNTIAELKAQLASGSPGLTAEQGIALMQKISDIKALLVPPVEPA